jgi:hypothetical protein
MAWPLALVVLLAGPTADAPSASSACDMHAIRDIGQVHNFLGMRAVEIVDRASRPGWETGARLRQLVSPQATFGLGAGDVGVPLGAGAAGAHALAVRMNADSYRFLGWDYMPMPIDPCSRQEVQVEFIDNAARDVAIVKFTFAAGRLVKADGWHRTFHTGPICGVRASE